MKNEFAQFPLVRITMESMQHSIIHAMTDHFAKMDEACAAAVKQAVESFDYSGEVRRQTHELIKTALHRALEKEICYGPSFEAVQKAAQEIIRKQVEGIAR